MTNFESHHFSQLRKSYSGVKDFPGHSVLLLFLNVDSIGPISHICEWLNPQSDVGSEHANSFLQFQNESGEAQRKGKKL